MNIDDALNVEELRRRLLRPSGYLVMHETIVWFESVRETLQESGSETSSPDPAATANDE